MIATERLVLKPMSAADARAIIDGCVPDGADYAEGYPADGTLVAAAMVVIAGRDLGPWTMYQATLAGRVVAGLGFFDRPDAGGSVRIGFSETAEAREAMLSEEAVTGLIAFAHEHGATRVTVDTADPRAGEVYRAAGMEQAQVCGGLVTFVSHA